MSLYGNVRRGQRGWSKPGSRELLSQANESSTWCFRHDCMAHWLAECSSHSGVLSNLHHESQTLGLWMESPIKAKDATGNPLTKTSASGLDYIGAWLWHHLCQISDRSNSPNLPVKGETSLPQVKLPVYRAIRTNVTSLRSTAQIN